MVATVYELNYSGSFHVLTTLSYAALSYYPSILSRLHTYTSKNYLFILQKIMTVNRKTRYYFRF